KLRRREEYRRQRIFGALDDHHHVVGPGGPEHFPDLHPVLLADFAERACTLRRLLDVADTLVGEVDEADVDRHGSPLEWTPRDRGRRLRYACALSCSTILWRRIERWRGGLPCSFLLFASVHSRRTTTRRAR